MLNCFIQRSDNATPIIFLTENNFGAWLETQKGFCKSWLNTQRFSAKPDTVCHIPSPNGKIEKVLVGQRYDNDFLYAGCLAKVLPQGNYYLENFHAMAALYWGMGAYQFTRYKFPTKPISQLVLPKEHEHIHTQCKAIYLVRDLINTPTEHMGPQALSEQAETLAKQFGAEFSQIVGDDLLKHNYPAIHTVGRASSNAPRLIELRWGDKNHSKITLVGKGVCFDSGGLDLKSPAGMALMKKDMGGAAHVLGLAYLIMQAELPIHLRVLIPAVENVVSNNAYKPGDVIKSRKGLTIEIGNTDAEGRVILCDALCEAASENPELIIDFATLTGAARVAVGTDLSALFTNNTELANNLMMMGEKISDPVWRMPLYMPYRKLIDSPIADINNNSNSPYGGAITAALFLKEFVPEDISWAHFDIMAWNVCNSPARPEGGEAMGIRTVFEYLQHRFCARSSAG